MKINFIKKVSILFICVLNFSCINNNFENRFERSLKNFLNIKNEETFPIILEGKEVKYIVIDDSTGQLNKLLSYDTKINSYLINKITSVKKTNYNYFPTPIMLTEGDICLILLIYINDINYMDLMPKYLQKEFELNGVDVFYQWLHDDIANRDYIKIRLLEILDNNM